MSQEGVKSAYRVFRILECFGQEQRDLSVSEIASLCKFPQSSTSALMRTMTELGYLRFDRGSRSYRPTLRLPLLVSWIGTRLFSGDKILQLMQELSEATGETILLAAENGRYARYMHVIEATGTLRLHVRAGQTRPYAQTAVGLALLSTWNSRRLTGYVHRLNGEQADPQQHVDLEALLQRVERFRKDGFVTSIGAFVSHGGAVAMLLPRQPDEHPLAVAISGFQSHVETGEEQWVALMREAIDRHFAAD